MKTEAAPSVDSELDRFASAAGLDTSPALALMGAVFNGTLAAGVGSGESGMEVQYSFNVVIMDDEGAAAGAVNSLLHPVREFQRSRESRFGAVPTLAFKEWVLDRNPGLREALEFALSPESQLLRDFREFHARGKKDRRGLLQVAYSSRLVPEGRFSEFDFMLRPRLLVEEPRPAAVYGRVDACHRGRALVYGGTSLRLADLFRPGGGAAYGMMADARTPVSEPFSFHLPKPGGSWILHGETADWWDPRTPYGCADVLLCGAVPGGKRTGTDAGPVPPPVWTRVLEASMAARVRGAAGGGWRGETGAFRAAFARRHQSYRRECEETGIRSIAVLELPVFLHRTLRALGDAGSSEEWKRRDLDRVFGHAEILRDRHLELHRRLEEEAGPRDAAELAARVREIFRSHE